MGGPLDQALRSAEANLRAFREDATATSALEQLAEVMIAALRSGHRVLVAGNGGSMAEAMHFAEEWTGRFRANRRPFPVLALADPTHLSCVANDMGFDEVFERMVEAFGQPGDVLLLLSTSGESPNILKAAEKAKTNQMVVCGLLGRGGGSLRNLCDVAVVAPGETADRIQEIHLLCLHALVEHGEAELT